MSNNEQFPNKYEISKTTTFDNLRLSKYYSIYMVLCLKIGNNNNDMLIYMQLNKLPNTRQHQVSKQAILVDNPLKINEKKYHYSLFYP